MITSPFLLYNNVRTFSDIVLSVTSVTCQAMLHNDNLMIGKPLVSFEYGTTQTFVICEFQY